MSISRGIVPMNGPGGRHGASSVCAVGNSLFSVHTAYRWERKKPPYSATAACRNRKGQVTTFQVLHSSPTPRYLLWNFGALRRQQGLKLFLTCHYQAQRGDAQSPSKELQAPASSFLTTAALPGSMDLLWDPVQPLLCLVSRVRWTAKLRPEVPWETAGSCAGRWPQHQCCCWLPALPRASKGHAGSAGAAAAQGLGCEWVCQGKWKAAWALKLFFPFLSKQKTNLFQGPKDY